MIKRQLDADRVFAIEDFLSADECTALIRRSESLVYEMGKVADSVVEDVRNNERILLDDPSLAADMFTRAKSDLPSVIDGQILVGFNERWRFYRYGPGQTFKPHRDGSYHRFEVWQESRLTFMIYLNDQCTGGETRFFQDAVFSGYGAGISVEVTPLGQTQAGNGACVSPSNLA